MEFYGTLPMEFYLAKMILNKKEAAEDSKRLQEDDSNSLEKKQ